MYLRAFLAGTLDPDLTDLPIGPAGIKQGCRGALATFPDMHVTIEDSIAEGDRVVNRCTVRGTDASQNKVVTSILFSILRFSEGKIVEEWELVRVIND